MRTTQVTQILRKAAKATGFKIGKVAIVPTGTNPLTGKPSAVPSAQFSDNIYLHYCATGHLFAQMQSALQKQGLTLRGHISSVGSSYQVVELTVY